MRTTRVDIRTPLPYGVYKLPEFHRRTLTLLVHPKQAVSIQQSTETPCGQRHSATQADTDTRKPHTNTTYDNNLAVGMYTSHCGGNQEISLTT